MPLTTEPIVVVSSCYAGCHAEIIVGNLRETMVLEAEGTVEDKTSKTTAPHTDDVVRM